MAATFDINSSLLTRERLVTGEMPELLTRLGTPETDFILRFDGGELWDEAENRQELVSD
jgi:hypothetical protein